MLANAVMNPKSRPTRASSGVESAGDTRDTP
jgi:hypothetical protein